MICLRLPQYVAFVIFLFGMLANTFAADSNPLGKFVRQQGGHEAMAAKRKERAAANQKLTAVSTRKDAQLGHAGAQNYLGELYLRGTGVPQDVTKAVYWWRKAAEQGFAEAHLNLGVVYLYGRGVRQNDKQGVNWFRKAAELGHAYAQWYLGGMYISGIVLPQDGEQAVYWWRKAAEQGDVAAREFLGTWYLNGEGLAQINILAYVWWHVAGHFSGREIKGTDERNIIDIRAAGARLTGWERFGGARVGIANNWIRVARQKRDTIARRMNRLQVVRAQKMYDEWPRRGLSPQ